MPLISTIYFFLNIFQIIPPTPKLHYGIGKTTPKTLLQHFHVCHRSSAGQEQVVAKSTWSGSCFPKNWELFFQDLDNIG